MNKFWNWVEPKDDNSERIISIDGVIAEESWWDDEVTPAIFKNELDAGNGDIKLLINSPGGDCVAASQIYTMLKEYNGNITVEITGMAASAASVIAMAGNKITMSPTSLMMIHNPFTMACGDTDDMRKAINLLDEVKEGIINAYELKTGLSRTKISHLMDAETWMSAATAKDLGFCDEILFTEEEGKAGVELGNSINFSRKNATMSLLNKVVEKLPKQNPVEDEGMVNATDLKERLDKLKYI